MPIKNRKIPHLVHFSELILVIISTALFLLMILQNINKINFSPKFLFILSYFTSLSALSKILIHFIRHHCKNVDDADSDYYATLYSFMVGIITSFLIVASESIYPKIYKDLTTFFNNGSMLALTTALLGLTFLQKEIKYSEKKSAEIHEEHMKNEKEKRDDKLKVEKALQEEIKAKKALLKNKHKN